MPSSFTMSDTFELIKTLGHYSSMVKCYNQVTFILQRSQMQLSRLFSVKTCSYSQTKKLVRSSSLPRNTRMSPYIYIVFPLLNQLPFNSGGRSGPGIRDLIFPSIGTLMRTRKMQASKIIEKECPLHQPFILPCKV